MKTLTLLQGSPKWLAHRRTTRNASEAPALMGASPYMTRAELVRQHATGIEREVDDATQARFDRGHQVEPALRALAEQIIGQDLYPVTGVSDDGYLGASFDGVTLDEGVIFEAKQHNAEKREQMLRGQIPPVDYWQIVQQFAVNTDARECLYLCGDGAEATTAQLWIKREDVEQDIPKLRAAWAQFDADVANFVPTAAAAPAAAGRAPDQLPALRIELTGMVTESNLREFREHAIAVFRGISTDLQTDQDFADAEQTVKWCKDIEDRLKGAKDHALSQTASIDDLFRSIDAISAEARAKRLELEKLVTREKETRRGEIVAKARASVQAHYDAINATLGQHALVVPATLPALLGASIKGKRTLSSIKDAADAAAAQAKIDASQVAERTRACIAVLGDFDEHAALFADRVQLCALKQPDDLRNLARARVAEHQQREAERLERERAQIRQEEADRLAREQAETEKKSAAGAPAAQQPLDDAANNAGVATGSRNPSPSESVTRGSLPPAFAAAPNAAFRLGELNGWIAPLSISADGLASLGIKPVRKQGAAQLYAANDLPRICAQLTQIIAGAPARAADKQAA